MGVQGEEEARRNVLDIEVKRTSEILCLSQSIFEAFCNMMFGKHRK